MRAILNSHTGLPSVEVGSFTKEEAARKIIDGCRHVHSSPMGSKDPGVKTTTDALKQTYQGKYVWESGVPCVEVNILSSSDRHRIIQTMSETVLGKDRPTLRRKAQEVLEELITNAIYHAYRQVDGSEKYNRQNHATLLDSETVRVMCRADQNGLFISVADRGGTMCFETLRQTLARCYFGGAEPEAKASGAGLGLYMVFEAVTHLKITTTQSKLTEVSCWIADRKTYDQSIFSFNFFEERPDAR